MSWKFCKALRFAMVYRAPSKVCWSHLSWVLLQHSFERPQSSCLLLHFGFSPTDGTFVQTLFHQSVSFPNTSASFYERIIIHQIMPDQAHAKMWNDLYPYKTNENPLNNSSRSRQFWKRAKQTYLHFFTAFFLPLCVFVAWLCIRNQS